MTTQTWTVDTAHSSVDFSVRHLVIAKVRGSFSKWSGALELDTDDLSKASVTATIDVASIDTNQEQRDAHLRSPDFFEVEKHPTMTFKSTRVERSGDRDLKITGDLTIKGITREVTLDAEFLGRQKDPWGNDRVAFSASTSINRKDFGLTWNQVLETGGVAVSEKVEITLEIQATKAKPAA